MIRAQILPEQAPALTRLLRLVPLDGPAIHAVRSALNQTSGVKARREIVREGAPISHGTLIVSGWAARARLMKDGSRQFLSILLPGDIIGLCRHERPLAVSTVVALTDVELCRAPVATDLPALAEAYAVSGALEEAYLFNQVTRLGRLNAQDRIANLFLELRDRLDMAGLASANEIELPLTQETLADVLGLTSVHVNRMLQLLKNENEAIWTRGRLVMATPERLAQRIGYEHPRIARA